MLRREIVINVISFCGQYRKFSTLSRSILKPSAPSKSELKLQLGRKAAVPVSRDHSKNFVKEKADELLI